MDGDETDESGPPTLSHLMSGGTTGFPTNVGQSPNACKLTRLASHALVGCAAAAGNATQGPSDAAVCAKRWRGQAYESDHADPSQHCHGNRVYVRATSPPLSCLLTHISLVARRCVHVRLLLRMPPYGRLHHCWATATSLATAPSSMQQTRCVGLCCKGSCKRI